MIRAKYKVMSKLNDASCFYCKSKCKGVLTFEDGSECWICPKHAFLQGKVKKFSKNVYRSESSPLKSNSNDFTTGKNGKMAISGDRILKNVNSGIGGKGE